MSAAERDAELRRTSGARLLSLMCAALAMSLTACGTSGPAARTDGPKADPGHGKPAPPARPPVRITSPDPGAVLQGQPRGRDLTAVLRVSGLAAPRQQLDVLGTCGTIECSAIAFANRRGRWRTELQLTAAAGNRKVRIRAAYAEPHRLERPARVLLRLSSNVPRNALPEASGKQRYQGARPVIVIGDSLAVGMGPYLQADLAPWHVSVDARIGRPLGEGMRILASTPIPGSHAVLAFSLFTNDSPDNVGALGLAVREAVDLVGPHGCVLWATISRPPLNGVSYDAANARLHALAADPRLADQLILVPWSEEVALHPEWHARDRVHATADGYRALAQLYAEAARSCAA